MKKADSTNKSIDSQPENQLTALPNIGNVLADRLTEVDIKTIKELKTLGSEKAFIRLQVIDNGACINELYALEGAIQGIRWHHLDERRKYELKIFYQQTRLHK